MSALIPIISAICYSSSLFLSCSAAFLFFVAGLSAWGFATLLGSFVLSVLGMFLIQLVEDRYVLPNLQGGEFNGGSDSGSYYGH